MSLMDEFKKIIHPYDDEDYDYEEEQQFPTQRPGKDSYFDDRKEDRRGHRQDHPDRQGLRDRREGEGQSP